jgi:hypothetical protein
MLQRRHAWTLTSRHDIAAELELQRPDAVHVSVWSPFATQVALQTCALAISTLVTVHSLWNYPALTSVLRHRLHFEDLPVLWSAVPAGAQCDAARSSQTAATPCSNVG